MELAPLHTTEHSPTIASSPHRSALLRREMPGLDALRGVAILAVFAKHALNWYLPPGVRTGAVRHIAAAANGGWLGVNLFFVLSGFLITGILLDKRTSASYWRGFYTRRALRILPLYFLVLVLLRVFVHLGWPYLVLCAFFMANLSASFGMYHTYNPLWSLAVEEQFYLVWPLLVRRLRLRTLVLVCAASILISPVLRALSAAHHPNLGNTYTATWLTSDNLAFGAMIAVMLRTRHATRQSVQRSAWLFTWLGGALLLLNLMLHWGSRISVPGAALQVEPFLFLFTALLLFALLHGARPSVVRVSAPLRFFGYISYGFYLLHILGLSLYDFVMQRIQPYSPELTAATVLLRFFVGGALITLACWLLRRFVEDPILRLKDKFDPPARPVH